MTKPSTPDYAAAIPTGRLILERNPVRAGSAMRFYETELLLIGKDEAVSVTTRTRTGTDSVPLDEWCKRTLAYEIGSAYDGSQIIDLDRLRDDLRAGGRLVPLVGRITAGHSIRWDGADHRGYLTPDAEAAQEALIEIVADAYIDTSTTTWPAMEWIQGQFSATAALDHIGLALDATDAQIAETATRIEDEAWTERVILAGDVEVALLELIADARADIADAGAE